MDSLLATYTSSDEEEDQQQSHQHQKPKQNQSNIPSQPTSKFFSSLPPPKAPQQPLTVTNPSSSKPKKFSLPEYRSDSALPPPNSSSASLFSRLPQPKAERSDPFSLDPKPKKVVQFRPPVMPKVEDDDDEEDDDKEERRKKDDFIPQAPSVKSFLSSIPAPRNSGSLGALPSSTGMGRRSILDDEVPALSNSNVVKDTVNKASDDQVKYENSFVGNDNSSNVNLSGASYVNYDNTYNGYVGSNENADVAATSADYASYDYSNYGGYENVDTNHSSYGPAAPASDDHANYSSHEGYSNYGNHGQYESKWIDRSSGDLEPEISGPPIQNVARAPGKRGRNEIPQDVIEVSQDELMKNRPREDQVKMTGIAFGPSYQPASSAKGKPTKLHKRKHQIGSLYFDMRSKEMELAERRSKGFLTKAETQAKYGW
ncbi:probable serine/threonine-protein kinase tsuA isoform X2 [Cynara cardunculus var. scolymus]|uniref:Proline-rich protein PRCC n=1 Tax=Cynara cardunculus var. scolymus TaxID=59895 RepID=A0A118JVR7_CYNCS|nr:probable serine/threonine-protein kinase tsuA isoform X2 [Cynara cardunculus var. scolymus]KVH94179.1 hypothetical protein Ccrd_003753 [Cynara cardunculus var. scolymus]